MVVTVVVMVIGVVVVVLMDGKDDDGHEEYHFDIASPVALSCVMVSFLVDIYLK